jgi:hypothetical protein
VFAAVADRAPIPGVLDEHERLAVEEKFGVGARQVVRDHVISHGHDEHDADLARVERLIPG